MLTLYDYLPSQNGWKIRQLLHHLERPYQTKIVSIFEGQGQTPEFRALNPTGAVPAMILEDGRTLAESNAILFYLAQNTTWLSGDTFLQAKTIQWLLFETEYVQSTVGSVRHWRMTGKIDRRPAEVVEARQAGGRAALAALERELTDREYLVGVYSIADISVFAYTHLAEEADISLEPYPAVRAWIERVKSQPAHLAERFPYSVDPFSSGELP